MEKYKELIGKKINFQINGSTLQSYKITEIRQTDRFMVGLEGSGKIFNCDIEWLEKVDNPIPSMDFPESVLNDLINNGYAKNPMMPNMAYVIDNGKKSQRDLWNRSK